MTSDELGNPQKLHMWLEVNGKRFQDNYTSDMIYDCASLISFMSKMITLYPGDIIFTGTPQGVDLVQHPKHNKKKVGDLVTMGIEKLGEHRYTCVKGK